jgi:hypothetical protein
MLLMACGGPAREEPTAAVAAFDLSRPCGRFTPTATTSLFPTFTPAPPSETPSGPPTATWTLPPSRTETTTATATIVPTLTATLIPPDPRSVTPFPTSRPVTLEPRPELPDADDITQDADGCFVADVDGCHWEEYGRFGDPSGIRGGHISVGMSTPCLDDEGLHFIPDTGEVSHFIS